MHAIGQAIRIDGKRLASTSHINYKYCGKNMLLTRPTRHLALLWVLLVPATGIADVKSDIEQKLPLQKVYQNALAEAGGKTLIAARNLLTNARRYAKPLLILLFKKHPKLIKELMQLAIQARIHPSIVIRSALEAFPHKAKLIQEIALESGVKPAVADLELRAFNTELQKKITERSNIKAQQPAIIEPSNHSGGSDLASPN